MIDILVAFWVLQSIGYLLLHYNIIRDIRDIKENVGV